MDQQFDAANAIAVRDAARRQMAARAVTPWWYPPLYGLGCGGIVASIALPVRLIAPGAALCAVVLAAGYAIWSRGSGLSVNGYRRGRTLPITIGLLIAFVVFGLGAMLLRFDAGIDWAPLACGAVFGIIAALASAAWDRAWRADILSQA